MKVILTKDVVDLGHRGDVVDVSDGYARNYLVPRSLAVKASEGALRQADAVRLAREDAERKARAEAEELAVNLGGSRVVVAARAGDEGKLYGSIGAHDIADAVEKFTGIAIDQRIVKIERPIKDIGLHEVTLMPHSDVSFQVTLDVIPA
jgi:large subunit ribosomal protein L9